MSATATQRTLPWRRYGAPISVALAPLLDTYDHHHPGAPVDRIIAAYQLAFEAHDGQLRKSGTPYISHPLAVAKIVAGNGLDDVTVCAALLHDAVEDTGVELSEISAQFGPDVALLVDGVTKLERVGFDNKEAQQAATFRKMLVAFSKDVRVLIIKLSDRLHNMRTLAGLPVWKQERTARETLDIYAPLAHRLGMQDMKQQLEDLAFATLWPRRYAEIEHMVVLRDPERDLYLTQMVAAVEQCLEAGNVSARLSGRPKHLWSIYEKMVVKGLDFDDIYDLVGIKIVVSSITDCYSAIGHVHQQWRPVPGRLKDYIANPKFNLYKALHTTVIGPQGKAIELQVRSEAMEETAEFGVASHWSYKQQRARELADADGVGEVDGLSAEFANRVDTDRPRYLEVDTEAGDDKSQEPGDGLGERTGESSGQVGAAGHEMPWLKRILDWQGTEKDPSEYMADLKMDLDQGEVFVFTPQGRMVPLQAGSTPVDFAYAVHTEVGHACHGALVDGHMVALDTRLESGNVVQIHTSQALEAGPSEDWLNFVVSAKARGKIRNWFSKESREDARVSGREQLVRALRREGLPANIADEGDLYGEIARQMNYADSDALDEAIGQRHLRATAVVARIARELRAVESTAAVETLPTTARRRRRGRPANEGTGVHVEGLDDVLVRLSGCCTPVPPDEILGFETRGRGVSVHRVDCANAVSLSVSQGDRLMEVEWDSSGTGSFSALVEVEALDRHALLRDVTDALTNAHVNIVSVSTLTGDDRVARMRFEFELGEGTQLGAIVASIKAIDSVYDAYRVIEK